MSFTGASIPGGEQQVNQNAFTGTSLSLNAVLNNSVKKAQQAFPSQRIILRCEPLPRVKGNPDDWKELFDNLVRLIVSYPPPGYRLFLFIGCEEVPGKNGQQVSFDNSYFLVRFHTNITTREDWVTANAPVLERCRLIIERLKGTLLVNNITNTGCVFAVTLPGKIESDANG